MTLDLFNILRQIPPTGPNGFEGLIASLLEALTGLHFALATSGSQEGRDRSSRRPSANLVAVQCKRYAKSTELNERELLGELVQAGRAISDLDLWVLVTSREVPSQLNEALNSLATEKGIGFLSISSGDGSPSSLEVLCAYSPEMVCAHPGVQAVVSDAPLRILLQQITAHPNYQERVLELKNTFSSPLAGCENWRVRNNQRFIDTLKSDRESRASHGQPINVEDPEVMLIRREAAWMSLDEWQQGWESTHKFLAILGEEGDGKTWSAASWLSERVKHTPEFPGVIFLSSTDISLAETSSTDLRSWRVALAIISHLQRNQFIRALAIGCLAEVITGRPDKYELFAWIIRTAPQNIWPDLRKEVDQLLAANSIVTRRAARRLLFFESSEEAYRLRETIPSDTSSDPLVERHQQDPCTSGFAWSDEDCVTCFQREDLPVQWLARQIERRCANPDLPVPDSLKAQFSSLTGGIDTQNLWVVLGTTSADHELKTYEPALAAYAPEAIAALIRSTARQITERRGMTRRQLSFSLVKHYLILNKEEQEAVQSAWEELMSSADTWGEEEEDAEMFIFQVVLAYMDGDTQLAALLRRPERSPESVVSKHSWKAEAVFPSRF